MQTSGPAGEILSQRICFALSLASPFLCFLTGEHPFNAPTMMDTMQAALLVWCYSLPHQ